METLNYQPARNTLNISPLSNCDLLLGKGIKNYCFVLLYLLSNCFNYLYCMIEVDLGFESI